MPLLFWIRGGLVTGWLPGKMRAGEGGNFLMDTNMGLAGAVAGGFPVTMATFHAPSRMFYANLAAILGALVLTALHRLFTGKRQYATQR